MLTPMPIVVNEHVKTCAFIRRPAPHPAKEKSTKLPQVCWHLNMDSDLFWLQLRLMKKHKKKQYNSNHANMFPWTSMFPHGNKTTHKNLQFHPIHDASLFTFFTTHGTSIFSLGRGFPNQRQLDLFLLVDNRSESREEHEITFLAEPEVATFTYRLPSIMELQLGCPENGRPMIHWCSRWRILICNDLWLWLMTSYDHCRSRYMSLLRPIYDIIMIAISHEGTMAQPAFARLEIDPLHDLFACASVTVAVSRMSWCFMMLRNSEVSQFYMFYASLTTIWALVLRNPVSALDHVSGLMHRPTQSQCRTA